MQKELTYPNCKKNEDLSCSFFTLGLFCLFALFANHNALFISDYYYFLIATIVFGCLSALYKGVFTLDSEFFCIVLLVLLCSISAVFNQADLDRGTLLSYFVWFLTYIALKCNTINKKSLDFVIKCFVLGSVIISSMVLILQTKYGETGRFTIQLGNEEAFDPNYLAAFLFNGLFFGGLYVRKAKKNVLLYISLAVILLGIIMTGSRAIYLCLGILCIGLIVQKNVSKKTTAILIACIVAVVFVVAVFPNLPESIQSRFDIFNLWDDSNKFRFEHWGYALKTWLIKPIFGFGAAHTKDLLFEYAHHSADAHNTFLTFLLQFGIVGFSIVIFVIKKNFFPKSMKKDPFLICYIIGFLLYNSAIANHLGISFWVPLILVGWMHKFSEDYFL